MEAICTSPFSPDFSPCIEPRELTVDEIDAVAGGVIFSPAVIAAIFNLGSSLVSAWSSTSTDSGSGSKITVLGEGSTCVNCNIVINDDNVTMSGN